MSCLALYQLKGGVGKTSAAVNLAWLAARDGWPTLLWDLDPQGAASWILGVDAADIKLGKLLKGAQPAGRLVTRSAWSGLDVLPAAAKLRQMEGRLHDGKAGRDWLRRAVEAFSEHYRLVVLDCPPALGEVAEQVFRAADWLLLPVVPGPLAQRAVAQVTEHINESVSRPPKLRPFLSMVDRRRALHREYAQAPTAHLAGASPVSIPASALVERMGLERKPLPVFAPEGHVASQSYEALWRDVRRLL